MEVKFDENGIEFTLQTGLPPRFGKFILGLDALKIAKNVHARICQKIDFVKRNSVPNCKVKSLLMRASFLYLLTVRGNLRKVHMLEKATSELSSQQNSNAQIVSNQDIESIAARDVARTDHVPTSPAFIENWKA